MVLVPLMTQKESLFNPAGGAASETTLPTARGDRDPSDMDPTKELDLGAPGEPAATPAVPKKEATGGEAPASKSSPSEAK
jgi:hypothetical protein